VNVALFGDKATRSVAARTLRTPHERASRMNSVLENFTKTAADDYVLAGLKHPHADDDGVCATWQAGASRSATGSRIELDARLAVAHLLHDLDTGGADATGIISHEQMRNVIGDRRDEDCGLDRRYCFHVFGNTVGALAEFVFHGGIVLAEEPIDSGDHADDVFFGDL